MSTTALILFKDLNDVCFGVPVQFDGYIDNGVGEFLHKYWNNEQAIKDLCMNSKYCLRSLGASVATSEFYTDLTSKQFASKLKGLDFQDALNQAGNYDYTYLWKEENKFWTVFHPKYGECLLGEYFNALNNIYKNGN